MTDKDKGAPLRDGLSSPSPCATRRQIAAFLSWWAEDQAEQAGRTTDIDKEVEFSIRAETLKDAARDVLDFGDARYAGLKGIAHD